VVVSEARVAELRSPHPQPDVPWFRLSRRGFEGQPQLRARAADGGPTAAQTGSAGLPAGGEHRTEDRFLGAPDRGTREKRSMGGDALTERVVAVGARTRIGCQALHWLHPADV
jgi:hypothetical protein